VFRYRGSSLQDIDRDLGEHRGMRATVLAGLLLLTVSSQAGDRDPRSLVGQRLPDAERGDWATWKLQDDWMIDEDGPGTVPRYGWAVWTRRGQAIVFLRRGDRVADAVRVELPRGSSIGFACTPDGAAHPDTRVVALVDDPPLPPGARCVFSGARKAWRLDRTRGRIEPIPTTGIRCQRECPWD
jgi:hypothetical protein